MPNQACTSCGVTMPHTNEFFNWADQPRCKRLRKRCRKCEASARRRADKIRRERRRSVNQSPAAIGPPFSRGQAWEAYLHNRRGDG